MFSSGHQFGNFFRKRQKDNPEDNREGTDRTEYLEVTHRLGEGSQLSGKNVRNTGAGQPYSHQQGCVFDRCNFTHHRQADRRQEQFPDRVEEVSENDKENIGFHGDMMRITAGLHHCCQQHHISDSEQDHSQSHFDRGWPVTFFPLGQGRPQLGNQRGKDDDKSGINRLEHFRRNFPAENIPVHKSLGIES